MGIEFIEIKTVKGGRPFETVTKQVRAYVKDGFAIHHTPFETSGWTLTHVQSGYAIKHNMKRLPYAHQLLTVMRDCGIDWSEIYTQQMKRSEATLAWETMEKLGSEYE